MAHITRLTRIAKHAKYNKGRPTLRFVAAVPAPLSCLAGLPDSVANQEGHSVLRIDD